MRQEERETGGEPDRRRQSDSCHYLDGISSSCLASRNVDREASAEDES